MNKKIAVDSHSFETVIGLEIHIQLNTHSKMFCSCPVKFGRPPNTLTCNICAGFPGTLPAVNAEALRAGIILGLAVQSTISQWTRFDRKHYFYPDLPKGYQITQVDQPLCRGGVVRFESEGQTREIRIHRIHLEEDAGKSIHSERGSGVDLNRAGVPLLELVTEPDLRSPQEAHDFLQSLRHLVRYLDVSDGDMEKGSLRCDGNISLRPVGQDSLNAKVEIKNVNSYKYLQQALEFEAQRQEDLYRQGRGEEILSETRQYDSAAKETRVMRGKEACQDYRYFVEPDILPVEISETMIEEIRSIMPELPAVRMQRIVCDYALSKVDARTLLNEKALADFFEKCVAQGSPPKKTVHWILGDLLAISHQKKWALQDMALNPSEFARLVLVVDQGKITQQTGKEVLEQLVLTGGSVDAIIQERDLGMIQDSDSLTALCQEILKSHPTVVAQYKEGKSSTMAFFIGQAMKQSKGKADPKQCKDILSQLLAE